jgi:hypothetical protein
LVKPESGIQRIVKVIGRIFIVTGVVAQGKDI